LNQIPYPWTLLGSNSAHLGLQSSLLELKVLIPFWTRTPSQFGLASSIFFLSSPGQLTRVTFTLLAYPNLARIAYPIFIRAPYLSLTRWHQCLPGLVCSYPAKLPYPILLPIRLLLTRSYTVLPSRINLPDVLTRSGKTSLHPTAYPTLSNHLTQQGTLQLASPENFLIGLPP
jgi:hypothetical protein